MTYDGPSAMQRATEPVQEEVRTLLGNSVKREPTWAGWSDRMPSPPMLASIRSIRRVDGPPSGLSNAIVASPHTRVRRQARRSVPLNQVIDSPWGVSDAAAAAIVPEGRR